ncbi:unnamed protein product, partial [marine sediment metagenome]
DFVETGNSYSEQEEQENDGPGFCANIIGAVFSMGIIALGISMIIIGNNHHCSNNMMKVWIIAHGSIIIMQTIITLINNISERSNEIEAITVVLGIVALGWLIYGTILFWGKNGKPSDCDQLLYDLGKYYIITLWCLYGIILCCIGAVAAVFILNKNLEDSS